VGGGGGGGLGLDGPPLSSPSTLETTIIATTEPVVSRTTTDVTNVKHLKS